MAAATAPAAPAAPATDAHGHHKGHRFLGITLGHSQNMIFLTQVAFFCLYGGCTTFDSAYSNRQAFTVPFEYQYSTQASALVHLFVMLFVFLGLGFVFVQNNKSPLQSLGFTLALGATTIEWAILLIGFWDNGRMTRTLNITGWPPIPLNFTILLNALYIAATIIISYGTVAGRVSFGQAYALAFWEVFFATAAFKIMEELRVNDYGGTMYIHFFGATFGLAASWALKAKAIGYEVNSPRSRDVAVFGFIGTILLFVLYPIFNTGNLGYVIAKNGGVFAPSQAIAPAGYTNGPAYAILARGYFNSAMAVASSVGGAYLVSKANSHNGDKLTIWQIQSAAVSGGAAIAATAPMLKNPWGALMVGALSGVLTTWAQTAVTPHLVRMGVHDSSGIFAAHWIPGFLGCLASAVAVARVVDFEDWEANQRNAFIYDGRTSVTQGGHQVAYGAIVLGLALLSGLLVGALLNLGIFEAKTETSSYDEEEYEGLSTQATTTAAIAAAHAKTPEPSPAASHAPVAPATHAAEAPKVDAPPAEPAATA